jgi:hypothetical protein
MESNRQLLTSYLYVKTKQILLEDKTSLNDCMLSIKNYDKIFWWMDGWVEGWIDEWMDESILRTPKLLVRLKMGLECQTS